MADWNKLQQFLAQQNYRTFETSLVSLGVDIQRRIPNNTDYERQNAGLEIFPGWVIPEKGLIVEPDLYRVTLHYNIYQSLLNATYDYPLPDATLWLLLNCRDFDHKSEFFSRVCQQIDRCDGLGEHCHAGLLREFGFLYHANPLVFNINRLSVDTVFRGNPTAITELMLQEGVRFTVQHIGGLTVLAGNGTPYEVLNQQGTSPLRDEPIDFVANYWRKRKLLALVGEAGE